MIKFFVQNKFQMNTQRKIKGGNRANKLETRKRQGDYVVTPPKYTYKNTMDVQKNNYVEKMGYNYEYGTCKVLDWMKQEFENKTELLINY